jgi:hypothetical protein
MLLDDSTQDTQNRNELAEDNEAAEDNNTEAIDEDEGPHPATLPLLLACYYDRANLTKVT